jgi:transcriptional regulator with XRE-family HTH domain
MNDLGERMRSLRRARGFTQQQLAEGLCDRSYVSQIEAGRVVPAAPVLHRLLERLGATWADMDLPLESPAVDVGLDHVVATVRRLARSGDPDRALELGTSAWWSHAPAGMERVRRLTEALVALTDSLADPADAVPWLQAAWALHLRDGRAAQAVQIGRRLQAVLVRSGRHREAVAVARTLLFILPPGADAAAILTSLGTALLAEAHAEEAEAVYARAAVQPRMRRAR